MIDNNADKNLGKLRIIQESVPGKEVTLAHIIASPDEIIYHKLGLDPMWIISRLLSPSWLAAPVRPRSSPAILL